MSMSFSCHCPERKKPLDQRQWVVVTRHSQCSAFNGYREQWSDYSLVYCKACRALGRTKADYVNKLPDGEIT